ncbi:glycosyltransferase [Aeromonas intestinalis]
MSIRKYAIIFGPTVEGALALYLLQAEWTVIAFCDNDLKKTGTFYQQIPIISPRELAEHYSHVPVIVANYRYQVVISLQLLDMKHDEILIFKEVNGIGTVYPASADPRELFLLMLSSKKSNNNNDLSGFCSTSHGAIYDPELPRVFNFTFFKYAGECGGPAGVIYRLQKSNQSLGLVKNDFYVFGDKMISPACVDKPRIFYPPKCLDIYGAIIDLWEHTLSHTFPYNNMNALDERLAHMQAYMNKVLNLHEQIHFTSKDIYIFHDIEAAFIFSSLFDFTQKALVYHGQGSMYYEYLAYGGMPSDGLRITWDLIHKHCLSGVKKNVYPSLGGYDSLLKTAPELESLMADYHIVHNGCEVYDFSYSDKIKSLLAGFLRPNTIKFVTVAMVNDAKAIENIPIFLGDLKKRFGKDIQWVLVGSGPRNDLVERNIIVNDLNDNVLWIKERQVHHDIQYIFDECDFYIILQKYSICDFATIEAMGRGCIPVLSDVPGNKAYVSYGNGCVVTNFSDASCFIEMSQSEDMLSLIEKNIKVQREYFSEKSFLNGYHELSKQLTSG